MRAFSIRFRRTRREPLKNSKKKKKIRIYQTHIIDLRKRQPKNNKTKTGYLKEKRKGCDFAWNFQKESFNKQNPLMKRDFRIQWKQNLVSFFINKSQLQTQNHKKNKQKNKTTNWVFQGTERRVWICIKILKIKKTKSWRIVIVPRLSKDEWKRHDLPQRKKRSQEPRWMRRVLMPREYTNPSFCFCSCCCCFYTHSDTAMNKPSELRRWKWAKPDEPARRISTTCYFFLCLRLCFSEAEQKRGEQLLFLIFGGFLGLKGVVWCVCG